MMALAAVQLEALLVVLALVTLLGDAFWPTVNKRSLGLGLAALVTLVLLYSFALPAEAGTHFHGMYRLDALALYFKRLFLVATVMVLVMGAETLPSAMRARKVLGGGMRQAGIIAAGGLYALRNNVARLADDHRRARRLAEALAALPGLEVDLGSVQTNMVFAGTRGTGVPAADLVERLAAEGVLCLDEAPWSVRFVTHLDVDDAGVERAIAGVTRVLGA